MNERHIPLQIWVGGTGLDAEMEALVEDVLDVDAFLGFVDEVGNEILLAVL